MHKAEIRINGELSALMVADVLTVSDWVQDRIIEYSLVEVLRSDEGCMWQLGNVELVTNFNVYDNENNLRNN